MAVTAGNHRDGTFGQSTDVRSTTAFGQTGRWSRDGRRTDFDPEATQAGLKSRSAAVPAVLRLCSPCGRIRRKGRQCTTVPTAGLIYCTEQSLATGEKRGNRG